MASDSDALLRYRRLRLLLLLLGPALLLAMAPFVLGMLVLAGYSVEMDLSAPSATLSNWLRFFSDPFMMKVVWDSARLALVVTFLTLLVAYPTAAALVRLSSPVLAGIAYIILFSPLLMSVVVRSYGWILLLSDQGLVNSAINSLPFPFGPLRLIFNETGVMIAMIHVLLPFAVLPLVSLMMQIPETYREAAFDLGAGSFHVFRRVTFPLTLPGVLAGVQIVFALSISMFVTPSMLGGGRVLVLSRLVYDNIGELEWSLAAVQALTLLVLALAILVLMNRFNRATYEMR